MNTLTFFQLLNYKENDLKSILERSAKLISLIDLAGDHKFLKTTIYGLSGYSPDYAAILVNPRIGWNEMSDEHLTIAHAFDLPIFVIISKIDLVGAERIGLASPIYTLTLYEFQRRFFNKFRWR